MMTQDDIARLLSLEQTLPPLAFSAVTEDSRRVGPGCLFVSVKGEKNDGHDYAQQAVDAGAVAIIGNRPNIMELAGAPYIRYEHPRRAAGLIAHALAGAPTRRMRVIGITGTNGKTSTACLVQAVLKHAGLSCANFGTLGYDIGDECLEAAHTTPFGEELAAMFARADNAGCSHVVMEVSSHALAQERVAGIAFSAAAFTNLSQDHLDYHEDMESYLAAKIRLFDMVRDEASRPENNHPFFTVVNNEDPAAGRFAEVMPDACYRYGAGGQVTAHAVLPGNDGVQFQVDSPWGAREARIRLAGRHNVLNALCAFTVCACLETPLDAIVEGLASLSSVPGRFEPVSAGQPFQVIVDYAHTDDGLRNALEAARALCDKRVIVVFGCGGDRDKGKRPKMGAVAAALADYCVVTSDNPRTEDPYRILLDIEVGLQHGGAHKQDDYTVIESRSEAIAHAIAMAQPGDLVLIAGKGHETHQIIGARRLHFDDREAAREALEEMHPCV